MLMSFLPSVFGTAHRTLSVTVLFTSHMTPPLMSFGLKNPNCLRFGLAVFCKSATKPTDIVLPFVAYVNILYAYTC